MSAPLVVDLYTMAHVRGLEEQQSLQCGNSLKKLLFLTLQCDTAAPLFIWMLPGALGGPLTPLPFATHALSLDIYLHA